MSTVAKLLDEVKDRKKIRSDNALAKKLETQRQVVSQWRYGLSYPSEENIAQLAEMADDDPGKWLLNIKISRTEGKARLGWESIANRLSNTNPIHA